MREISPDDRGPASEGDSEAPPASRWHAPLVLAVVLIAIVVSQTFLSREAPPERAEQDSQQAATGKNVVLMIEGGEADDEQTVLNSAWRRGMTVLDALEGALDKGKVDRSGEGEQAFVHAIAGQTNEGADGRNWQYYVNGERGRVSAGAKIIEPNDRVLWKFAPYE